MSSDPQPLTQPEGRGSFVTACAVHAVLAGIVLGVTVTRPLHGIPQPANLHLWFPLAFAAASLIVYAMAARLRPGDRSTALSLDLVAWLALPGCIIASRLNVAWTPAWLTAAAAIKTLSCLTAIYLAARTRESPRGVGIALAAQFLNVSLVTLPYTRYPGMPNSVGLQGDEPHYLAETAALLYDHSFYDGRIYPSRIFVEIFGKAVSPTVAQTRVVGHGHYAPLHDLGLSILAVPFFAVGADLGVYVGMAVVASLTVYLIYRLVLFTGVGSEIAVLGVAASCFLLPFLPYGTAVLTEMPMAFVAAATGWYLLGRSRSTVAYAGVTILLATLPWIHTRSWPLLLPLLLGVVLSQRSWIRRAIPPLAVGTSELAYLVLLRLIYGQWMLTPNLGTRYVGAPLTPTKLLIALESPFLDPQHGLFLIAPVFLIAFAAWPVLVRRVKGSWPIVLAVACYAFAIGVGLLFQVAGAFSPPGRLMVCCVPLLAPALALGLVRLRGRGLSPVFWLLVGYGALCAFAVLANRQISLYPGPLTPLAELLQIRGPKLTITGAGPWYAALVVIVVLIALALVIGLGGRRPTEIIASSDAD